MLDILPKEILWQILTFLSKEDLYQLRLTQRRFYQVTESEAFFRYRLDDPNRETFIEIKPAEASYFEWYYLMLEEKLFEDPISLRLNLTVTQAYYLRKRIYHYRLRQPAIRLLDTIKRRDRQGYLEVLATLKQKDIKKYRATVGFFYLPEEIIYSAIFTDDPFYLRELLTVKKFYRAFTWHSALMNLSSLYLISRSVYQLLESYFKGNPLRGKGILEDSPVGQATLDWLHQRPLQIDVSANFKEILANLEVRRIEETRAFYNKYSHFDVPPMIFRSDGINPPSLYVPPKRLIHYFTDTINYYRTNVCNYFDQTAAILFSNSSEHQLNLNEFTSISNLDGVYQLINSQLDLSPAVLDIIVSYLLKHDDAWDALVYLIMTDPEYFRDTITSSMKNLSVPKRKLLQAILNNQLFDFWQSLMED